MKTYTLEKLPDEPIIVCTSGEGYQMKRDLPEIAVDLRKLLDAQTEPTHFIVNAVIDPSLIKMDDVMLAVNLMVFGPEAVFHHPRILSILAVTPTEYMRMAYRGAAGPAYNELPIHLFDTLEDALTFARTGE